MKYWSLQAYQIESQSTLLFQQLIRLFARVLYTSPWARLKNKNLQS